MTGWEFALKRCTPRWVRKEDYGRFAVCGPEKYELPPDSDFRSVKLPHDWAVAAPFNRGMEQGAPQGYRDRWGIGWYRRKLEIEEKKKGYRYYLDFGAVYENCSVWVNRKFAGGQKYGYTPFRLDVTEALSSGGNEILVKVDNSNAPVDRWYSGCGIYRTVKLVEVEDRHLDEREIVVHTQINGGTASVRVDVGQRCQVYGALQEAGIWERIMGDDGAWATGSGSPAHREILPKAALSREFVAEGTEGVLCFEIPEPLLWTAETPNLYQLKLELRDGDRAADAVCLRIGIRRVEFIPGSGMYVNGSPVKLKGVCLHQEAGCVGNAVRPEVWRQRLENLKEMGCNAIRTAHHVFASEFMDLCDEMGFYVYEECFDKWTGGLYGRYFASWWQHDLDAMVKRDRNRPSVVIWGVGNEVENQAQTPMLEILKTLTNYVKVLDGTRPVSCAMNPHFSRESVKNIEGVKDIQKLVDEESNTEIFDVDEKIDQIGKIGEIVDILACNYQEQWYERIHERIPDRLILGTEIYQYFQGHYDQMQNFTEKNPALVPAGRDYCIGSFLWTGYDYLGESMGYPAKGWSGAPIHTNNERRPGYYILQSYWSEKPMVHFSVMDYSVSDEGVKEHWDMPFYADHWHFPQFQKAVIPFIIVCNCEEAALYLNGKRFFLPKPSECPDGVIHGYLPWQAGTVRVVGLQDGKEVCSHVTVTPQAAVSLRFDRELTETDAVAGKQFLLTVRAVDDNKTPCFRENGKVCFRVEGPAGIVAVDNGDITGNEPYQENFIHLYHGSASVMVELSGEPGRVAVWADGCGLRSGETILVVGNSC